MKPRAFFKAGVDRKTLSPRPAARTRLSSARWQAAIWRRRFGALGVRAQRPEMFRREVSCGILEAESLRLAGVPSAQLRDAAASLHVGRSRSGERRHAADPPGQRAALALRSRRSMRGEEWLLRSRADDQHDPCTCGRRASSSVRRNRTTWFHQTECFGPVLRSSRADNRPRRELQNAVQFGLTAGFAFARRSRNRNGANACRPATIHIDAAMRRNRAEIAIPAGGSARASGRAVKRAGRCVNLFRHKY